MSSLLPDLMSCAHTSGYPALWLIVIVGAAGILLPTDPLLLVGGAFAMQ